LCEHFLADVIEKRICAANSVFIRASETLRCNTIA